MFKIDAEPTFEAALHIKGQGRDQTLNVTYRHKTRDEYQKLVNKAAEDDAHVADAVLALVEKWDADGELNKKTVKRLGEQQPGADWAIIIGWAEADRVELVKN
jgi:hypothetical protein